MRPEAKRLKLISIATMFVGIIFVVAGIILTVRGAGFGGVATIVSGVLGAFVGIRGSLLANVPSTAGKIIAPASVCALVCVALGVVSMVVSNGEPYSLLGGVVPGLFCTCVALNGRTLVKALEKI